MSQVFGIKVTETYEKTYWVKANSYDEAEDALDASFATADIMSPAFDVRVDGDWNYKEVPYEFNSVYDTIDLDATETEEAK